MNTAKEFDLNVLFGEFEVRCNSCSDIISRCECPPPDMGDSIIVSTTARIIEENEQLKNIIAELEREIRRLKGDV